MERRICEAISSRALIRFDYGGMSRTAEVYAHGFNASKVETIRAFQVAGRSRESVAIGWKFFIVAKMTKLVVLSNGQVRPRVRSSDASHDFVIIHCELGD